MFDAACAAILSEIRSKLLKMKKRDNKNSENDNKVRLCKCAMRTTHREEGAVVLKALRGIEAFLVKVLDSKAIECSIAAEQSLGR